MHMTNPPTNSASPAPVDPRGGPDQRQDARPAAGGRGGGNPLVALFSNVWLGVFLMILLFVYSSVGSAMPEFRQKRFFEMTEFEWFHWWPFDVLVALICVNILVVTVRRIPPRVVNLGVWTIHAGILILAAGSVYYFGTKIEGEAPVYRRWLKIEAPGMSSPGGLVVLPENRTTVQTAAGLYTLTIQETNSEYKLLSGPDAGKRAHAVTVQVQPPQGATFSRQLLTGYPEFTEDVIPGQGRAIKVTGKALVDEDLKLSLEYEPQSYFHVSSSWALYVRDVGAKEWVEVPLPGMPRYNEYVSSRDQVFTDEPLPLDAMDLAVALPAEARLAGTSFHVTGYLPYAEMRRQWREGGTRANPLLKLNFVEMGGRPRPVELLALHPEQRKAMGGLVEFRYVPDEKALEEIASDSSAYLTISVPAAGVNQRLRVTQDLMVGNDGPWTAIEGTEFSYRLARVLEDLEIAPGRMASLAWVDLKTAEKEWTRVVLDDASSSFDLPGIGFDPHTAPAPGERTTDPRIVVGYAPSSAGLVFAALPDGRLFAAWNGPDAHAFRRFVRIGEALSLAPQVTVVPTSLLLTAQAEVKPYVVPMSRRSRDAGHMFSMIKLDITSGGNTQSKWLRYSPFSFPSALYEYPGRHPYEPQTVMLEGGRQVEVLFSRERERLPAPVALDDFELIAHVGGYTGQSLTVRNWRSALRFWDGGAWTAPQTVSVNSPTEYGGYWYYQAAWDPPLRGQLGSGMNYTVLGVGNRNGVNIMLAGCCLSVAGMIFAFYVKPRIKARRRAASAARGERQEAETREERIAEPVGV